MQPLPAASRAALFLVGEYMKKIKNLSESDFLKWVVGAFSAAFLIAAFLVPDRADMLSGLGRILSQPCKIPGNCFAIGGYASFANKSFTVILIMFL